MDASAYTTSDKKDSNKKRPLSLSPTTDLSSSAAAAEPNGVDPTTPQADELNTNTGDYESATMMIQHSNEKKDCVGQQQNNAHQAQPTSTTATQQKKSKTVVPLPSFSTLQLEAIFYPKFENEKTNSATNKASIRQEMLQHVQQEEGYLEVTLKHSGSLVLWSGGLRFYSKNSLENSFTYAAEILLRQHFERAWRYSDECDGLEAFERCSQYVQDHRLTLSFEVVTCFLGDHGQHPQRDFLILTAVADRQQQSFFDTQSLLHLAQQHRLPHNDSWLFATTASCEALFDLYDTTRERGLAPEVIQALDRLADAGVPSLYPHVDFQGDILEGLIFRYVPYVDSSPRNMDGIASVEVTNDSQSDTQEAFEQLAVTAKTILQQVPVTLSPSWDACSQTAADKEKGHPPTLTTNLRDVASQCHGDKRNTSLAQDSNHFASVLAEILQKSRPSRLIEPIRRFKRGGDIIASIVEAGPLQSNNSPETKRLTQLVQDVDRLQKSVSYSLVKETLPGRNKSRFLCSLHVMHDNTFQLYHKQHANHDDDERMPLFRGFCVELGEEQQESDVEMMEDESELKPGRGVQARTKALSSHKSLMLKMKYVPYMIRTFVCRNNLKLIDHEGIDAFMQVAENLLIRWDVSSHSIAQRWMPVCRKWASYVHSHMNGSPDQDDELPPLNSYSYLAHLEHCLSRESEEATSSATAHRISGMLFVIGLTETNAKHTASLLGATLGSTKMQSSSTLQTSTGVPNGVVVYSDYKSIPMHFLKKHPESIALVFCGCGDADIVHHTNDMSESETKRCIGMLKSLRARKVKGMFEISGSGQDGTIENEKEIVDVADLVKGALPPQEESKRKIFVFFAGIPGCGKSSLLRGMQGDIEHLLNGNSNVSDVPTRNVRIIESDKLNKQEMSTSLQQEIGPKGSSVLIIDKNAPPSAWTGKHFRTLLNAGTVPLPVVFDDTLADNNNRSFSMKFLAVCMARVLEREAHSHPGRLDRGTPNACLIVARFAQFYSSNHTASVEKRVQMSLCQAGVASLPPIRMPFFSASTHDGLPALLEATLQNAFHPDLDKFLQIDHFQSCDEAKELESKLRNSISNHREMLLSSCLTLEESKSIFLQQLSDRVLQFDSKETNQVAQKTQHNIINVEPEARIKLVSIDIEREHVHDAIKNNIDFSSVKFLDDSPELSDTENGSFYKKTHVTMAFRERSETSLIDEWGSLVGAKVALTVTSLVWTENVAALSVVVPKTCLDDREIPPCSNKHPHITVWLGKGARAHLSNGLFDLLAKNEAKKIEFPSSITLEGVVSFWDHSNNNYIPDSSP